MKTADSGVKRTLVEFYDNEHLENVISLLCGDYTSVVYVYFARANEPAPGDRIALSEWTRKRFGFSPRFLEIPENCVECALDSFRKLISGDGFYDFDVTGGSSIFIAATGVLLAESGGRNMSIHEYNTATGACVFRYPEQGGGAGRAVPKPLTVSELLALGGVSFLNGERPRRYDLDATGLRREILRLWAAVREELRAWNNFCTTASTYTYDPSYVLVEKQLSEQGLRACDIILERLERAGILSQKRVRSTGSRFMVSYRLEIAPESLFLYEKAGNLLEMLTYLAVVDSGVFSDCCVGVRLDWDSRRQDPGSNPANEIDLILARGHIPCFVSCKNTTVTKEYLYEILTMTRHFGGSYAVPVLVSSMRVNHAVRVRAGEMGVVLLDNVRALDAAEFAACLQKTVR